MTVIAQDVVGICATAGGTSHVRARSAAGCCTFAKPCSSFGMPRNRELMRVFRDLDLVEQLGSGVHRILSVYDTSVFHISEYFFETCFPLESDSVGVTPQVTPQVHVLLSRIDGEMTRQAIQDALGLTDREHSRKAYLAPALEQGVIEMTLPDKPQSRLQKYRLSAAGRRMQGRD